MQTALDALMLSAQKTLPLEHGPRRESDEKGERRAVEIFGATRCPPVTKAVFGLLPDDVVTAEKFAGLLHPDDIERFDAAYKAALEPDGPRVVELFYRIRRADDGAERWIKFNGYVAIEGDAAGRLIGAVRDVTEEKAALERNADSERLLGWFIGRAPAAIAMFDRDMRYLAASARWRTDFHLDRTPVGRSHYEIFPEISEAWKEVHRRGLAGAIESSEGEKFHRADGSVQWVKWEVRPWRNHRDEIGGVIISAEEITRQKRSEEALRLSEERLRLFLEQAPVAIAMFDRDMNYLAASQRWNEARGQDTTPVGRNHYEANPYVPDRLQAVHRRCLAGAVERSHGEKFVMPDGGERWIKWEDRPWRDTHGEIGGIVVSAEDITAAKETELALRAALKEVEILKMALDKHAIVAVTDPKGVITYANDRFCAVSKYSRQELVGGTHSVVHSDHHPKEFFREMWRTIEGGTVWRGEVCNRAKDGAAYWVDTTIVPFLDDAGSPLQYVAIRTDVTARKRAELALRQSQDRLGNAADAARLTYVQFDLENDWARVAENFGRILGYQPRTPPEGGRLRGARQGLLAQVVEPDKAAVSAMFDDIFAAQGGRLQFRVVGDDGVERWFDSSWGPEFDPGSSALRVFATVLDVTEQKSAEDALRLAQLEAERANLAKSKFLAAASHDLRQPVQSLVLLLSLLERQVKDNAKAVGVAEMMKKALGGLTSLLTAILDISRLDARVIEPEMQTVDLAAMLERIEAEYRPKAAALGLELRMARRNFLARADPTLLERALRNLIENALRYTPNGGALIGLRRRGDNVRIDVVDTGVGVPAEKATEIFEEFHQLDNPGRDLAKGLGLGLAIVSRVAALLDVKVEVSSRVGRGSRFSLLLPLAYAPAAVAATPSDAPDAAGDVLIIEDNAIVRFGLEELLRDWGFGTLSAASGEEAIEIARRGDAQFDAIITDYRLGDGFNGIEAALRVEGVKGRVLPKLVITGDTARERLEEIKAAGCEFLHKPIDVEELRVKLANLVGAKNGAGKSGAALSQIDAASA